MIKLKSLLRETDERYNQWVGSMVSTVKDYLTEEGIQSTDEYHAYDLIKTDFRAGAPDVLFQRASRDAITILKREGIVK